MPGQNQLALPLSLALASGEQLSAFSVDVRFDPAVTQCSAVVLEPSVLALNKQAQINQIAPGHLRLAIYGTDRQVFSGGRLGQCVMGIAGSAAPGSSLVSLQSGLSTDPNGVERSLALTDGRVWVDAQAPPPSDTTAPQISAASISQIIDGAATVTWTTNEPATCQLEYGTSTAYGIVVASATVGTSHQAGVSNLAAGTTYHYRFRCHDAANNEAVTLDQTFAAPESAPAPEPEPTPAPAPEPSGPSVAIILPQDGSIVFGSSTYLEFTVTGATIRSGTGYQHLHIKLDSGKVWHVYNTKPFLLNSLKPGAHTVSVMLAENDTHARVDGTTTQYVSFTVK